MDYEKEYKSLVAKVKKAHLFAKTDSTKSVLEDILPELREINEEEIRKDIIGGLMWQRDNLKSEGPHDNNLILPGFCLAVGKHLTYLEKQNKLDKMIVVSPEVWEDAISDAFENGKKEGEKQKPELVQQPPITYTYNSNASRDDRLKAALLALLNSDLLKVKEGGYFTKQDLIEWVERIPTDKPAEWSEKDEVMLNMIEYRLKDWDNIKAQQGYQDDYTLPSPIKWLESLRPCPSWKPSEEHLSALLAIFNDPNNIGSQTCQLALTDLYEQLKKL